MPLTGSASAIVGSTVVGHHLLHIEGYSRITEDIPAGEFIRSRQFEAGGYPWRIEYYPNGCSMAYDEFISIVLILDSDSFIPFTVQAKFSLLDQAGEQVPSHTRTTDLREFSCRRSRCGFHSFIEREFLEKSEYLKDDSFKIKCEVIIPKGIHTEDRAIVAPPPLIDVPPSNLSRHLGSLLAAKDGTDVTFEVAGEMFSAHRCVLAARSPVFKVELLGTMKESSDMAPIPVDDMEAEVFGALLAFLYTDELPDWPAEREAEMAQHLLVAADRYNLERLKLICEDTLCRHIKTATAATILALAEQHGCNALKKACSQFLSSPSTLNAVMATDGFELLARSCPSVLRELFSNIFIGAPADLKKKDKMTYSIYI